MGNINKNDIAIGDIIFLNNISAGNIQIGYRPFFVLSRNSTTLKHLHLFEISSRAKCSDKSKFPYNCPVSPTSQNGLNQESHIKCDQLFINCEHVLGNSVIKIGTLEKCFYSDIQQKASEADKNGDFYYYDQNQGGRTLRFPTEL